MNIYLGPLSLVYYGIYCPVRVIFLSQINLNNFLQPERIELSSISQENIIEKPEKTYFGVAEFVLDSWLLYLPSHDPSEFILQPIWRLGTTAIDKGSCKLSYSSMTKTEITKVGDFFSL